MPPAHDAHEQPPSRLALRLRTLRQLHGSAELGQADLAALGGISVRRLRALESTRCIPPSLRPWISLASALQCSLDELLAGAAAAAARPVVGVLLRSDHAIAVCCTAQSVLEVRTRGRRTRRGGNELAFAQDLCADYGACVIVSDMQPASINVSQVKTNVVEVARRIGLQPADHRALALWALATEPRLRRFLRLSRRTGWTLPGDRLGQRILVAAAFALAYAREPSAPAGQLQLPLES